jgi:beta-lactamase class A
LESVLAPIAKAHEGKVTIAVKNLATGECYGLNADEPMPTASLIKFPVMVETYYRFQEGKNRPGDMIVLSKDDKVPGSGILTTHFSPGATISLKDAVHLMIVYSDNTATNLVLDQIGIRSTNERMEQLGLSHTKVYAKSFKASTSTIDKKMSDIYGLGSTTANEMVKLLELLHGDKLVTPAACVEMRKHMEQCDDKDKFPHLLPPGTKVEHKTGSVNRSRTDAGLIYVPAPGTDPKAKKTQPIAICVMTNENKDQRWVVDNGGNATCAKVAKAVYDYFAANNSRAER